MKKALTFVFGLVFTLLFAYTCFWGIVSLTLFSEMDSMTHFDLDDTPTAYGEAPIRFYTDAGLCYEAVDVPSGITRDALTKNLSWDDYDEIIFAEWGMSYRLYRDPLQRGDGYVLIVPAEAALNTPLATVTRPLGYYAKEVTEE